jgi:hypothetical protein
MLVVALHSIISVAPSFGVLITIDARLPERLPRPPAGNLAPGFRAPLHSEAATTADGLTVIEEHRKTIDHPNRTGTAVRPYHGSDAPFDRFDEIVLLFEPGVSPPKVGTSVLKYRVERRDDTLRLRS